MDSDDARTDLLTVLTTEHYSQDARASIATTEAGSRASLYLLTLSSTLVALGFAGIDSPTFLPLACVALPVLTVVGLFTEARLVGTSLTNVAAQRRLARIRSYYATVHPDAGGFFQEAEPISAVLGVADGWRASLSTMATMIAIVNSAAAGVSVACLCLRAGAATAVAAVSGSVVGVVHLVAFLVYQQRRFVRLGSESEQA